MRRRTGVGGVENPVHDVGLVKENHEERGKGRGAEPEENVDEFPGGEKKKSKNERDVVNHLRRVDAGDLGRNVATTHGSAIEKSKFSRSFQNIAEGRATFYQSRKKKKLPNLVHCIL